MAKIKREEYLCLSAMLHARETRMLSREKALRMISAPTFEEAARMLVECGYEEMSQKNAGEIEDSLTAHKRAIYEELSRMIPERDLLDLFRIRYDYHNAKVLIKSEAMKVDGTRLMSGEGRYSVEGLKEAFVREKYSDISETLAKAMKDASGELARTQNPQTAEFILDQAYFRELTDCAQKLAYPFVTGYVKLLADCANLKSAVRCIKLGKTGAFLEEVMIPGGNVKVESLYQCVDADSLQSCFEQGALGKAAVLGTQVIGGAPMTAFELACDNVVNTYLTEARKMDYGCEPVVGYLAALENEITAVRMILCGKLTKVDQEVLKERLRELYA